MFMPSKWEVVQVESKGSRCTLHLHGFQSKLEAQDARESMIRDYESKNYALVSGAADSASVKLERETVSRRKEISLAAQLIRKRDQTVDLLSSNLPVGVSESVTLIVRVAGFAVLLVEGKDYGLPQ